MQSFLVLIPDLPLALFMSFSTNFDEARAVVDICRCHYLNCVRCNNVFYWAQRIRNATRTPGHLLRWTLLRPAAMATYWDGHSWDHWPWPLIEMDTPETGGHCNLMRCAYTPETGGHCNLLRWTLLRPAATATYWDGHSWDWRPRTTRIEEQLSIFHNTRVNWDY